MRFMRFMIYGLWFYVVYVYRPADRPEEERHPHLFEELGVTVQG